MLLDSLENAIHNDTLSQEYFEHLRVNQEHNKNTDDPLIFDLDNLNIDGYIFLFDELEELIEEIIINRAKMNNLFAEFRAFHNFNGSAMIIFSYDQKI